MDRQKTDNIILKLKQTKLNWIINRIILNGYSFENLPFMDQEEIEKMIITLQINNQNSLRQVIYFLRKYAKLINNDRLYIIVNNIDIYKLLSIAEKRNTTYKYFSHNVYKEIIRRIDNDKGNSSINYEYNIALFRSIYEGIYSNKLTVLMNLKKDDILIIDDEHAVAVLRSSEPRQEYQFIISKELGIMLKNNADRDVYKRNKGGDTIVDKSNLEFPGGYFKIQRYSNSVDSNIESSFYHSCYDKIASIKNNFGLINGIDYSFNPRTIHISGMMNRINIELNKRGYTLYDAIDAMKRGECRNIVLNEMTRCHVKNNIYTFRRLIQGKLNQFLD